LKSLLGSQPAFKDDQIDREANPEGDPEKLVWLEMLMTSESREGESQY
jgi:hypothetical protein